jgi:hypothetical protein
MENSWKNIVPILDNFFTVTISQAIFYNNNLYNIYTELGIISNTEMI